MTVCTDKRKPILANQDSLNVILEAWKKSKGWTVGRYAILPDHIHFFCSPSFEAPRLKRWITYWKSEVSRHWPVPDQHPIWQRDFWDRQLRSAESYDAKWSYVFNNPVRHGLVAKPEDWPYSGKVVNLEWLGP